MEELKQPALAALRYGRVRFHPESQHRFAISSLEEAPDWNISRQIWWGHQLPLWQCPDGHWTVRRGGAVRVRRVRLRRADPQRGRPRHVVLVGALAVRHPRLAGRHRRPPGLLPRRPEHDRARHHPPLGEPDDLLRPRADGRRPVLERRHPLPRPRADGRADVEEPRHGDEPARADRALRRRRDPLRADEDGLVAGRHLLGGRDRGGAEAREQALERKSPAAVRSRRGRRGASDLAGGAVDPRATLAGAASNRGAPGRVRLLPPGRRALPPDLRRLLRLVRGGDQAAPLRRRRRRARHGARGAGAAAEAAPSRRCRT